VRLLVDSESNLREEIRVNGGFPSNYVFKAASAHFIRSSHTSLFSAAGGSLFGVGSVVGFTPVTIDGGGGRGGGGASGSIGRFSSRREEPLPSAILLGSVERRDGPGSREEAEPAGERERRE
jgi:hypothetical protein